MTLNEKVDYKTSNRVCKRVKKFLGLKKTCLDVLERGDRDIDNETGLKEGGGIKMSTTVLHSRAALSLEYLPYQQCITSGLSQYSTNSTDMS